jgi:16S rRNA (uracil1498-N3)-methyltransferase
MRQYVAAQNPDSKGLLEVTGKDYRYFRQVLRLCDGDMVCVRLPSGALQNMTVCRVQEDKKVIVLQLCDGSSEDIASGGGSPISAESVLVAPRTDLWLFQFIAKSAKMDLIVRQAAECGVSTIVPVIGEFSQAGTTERNFRGERMERIIREARQQSGSPVATRVVDTVTVAHAAEMWKAHAEECGRTAEHKIVPGTVAVVLYERGEKTVPLHTAVWRAVQSSPAGIRTAAVACGAEGGISPSEIEILESGGFIPVHFDTNILRCETAALYGIASLQSAVTELALWQCRE